MKHTPRKRFGQNFLHDPAIIDRLVDIVDPQPGDHIVEIGPGKGALTLPLLERGAELCVVEIDRDLAAHWQRESIDRGALSVVEGDALKVDLRELASPAKRTRLVGNLPYNISTPLLFRFVDAADAFTDFHLMLQKEVVDRMCAEPGNKVYGRLTVMLAPTFRAQRMLRVSAGAFSPAPKVESAFVRLTPHAAAPFDIGHPQAYAAVVAAAFSMRRKTLRNSLRQLLSADSIEAAGIDPGARPETLPPADFARLAQRVELTDTDLS